MNITELQEKLKELNITMSARKISQIWGMDEASFSRKKRLGSDIKYENLLQLEQYLNINLTSINHQKSINKTSIINQMPVIDRIEITYWSELPEELKNPNIVSCWFDREVIENSWGMSAEHLSIITMVGDKMSRYWYPIRSGDILIIDTSQNHIMDNGVYFATSQNNTRFWIREMTEQLDGSIEFRAYPQNEIITKVYTKQQLNDVGFRVIGKVIKNVSLKLK